MSTQGCADSQVNALGSFIQAQRQFAGLSLRRMATMTGFSDTYLSQVERGRHQPSLKVLRAIADALKLSDEHLLSQAGWGLAAERVQVSVEDAILTDARLHPSQRTALLSVYNCFVSG